MIGKKPTVILYAYINRHAGTPKQRQKHSMNLDVTQLCYYVGFGVGFEVVRVA